MTQEKQWRVVSQKPGKEFQAGACAQQREMLQWELTTGLGKKEAIYDFGKSCD